MLNKLKFSKDHRENCHSHVHAIFGLPEVGGSWITVKCPANFINARQRMHYNHSSFSQSHQLWRDHIMAANIVVFLIGGESFFLNSGHIENIGIGQRLCQRCIYLEKKGERI